MIRGIKAIGEAIIKDMEDPQLDLARFLIEDLSKPRGEKGYVVILKINTGCFCQPKRSPFDNRKGAHFGHTFRTLTIEKGPI